MIKNQDVDWKDTLASLTGLPEGETQQTSGTQPTTENGKRETGNATTLHITVEKKGRGGKTATIIDGFDCSDEKIDELAKELKKRLGTGGSARGGEILIQGDRRNDVASLLRDKGFKIKG